jgi:hypothetical protein
MRNGAGLHGCATTTETIRRAVQHSEESLRSLSKRNGINPKTVAKWRKRCWFTNWSERTSIEDGAINVGFRRHTLLALDDDLYALRPTVPHLTRSSLHRCLQRHGISQLPNVERNNPANKKLQTYGSSTSTLPKCGPKRQTPPLFVAIDQTSNLTGLARPGAYSEPWPCRAFHAPSW